MATPDPAEPYRLPDCEEAACGLPRTGTGRVPAGWIQIHYSAGRDPTVEPDRWFCSAGCAAKGLVHADIVASRSDLLAAALRAERNPQLADLLGVADSAQVAEGLVGVAERAAPGLLGMPG